MAQIHDMSDGQARLTLLFCKLFQTLQEGRLPDGNRRSAQTTFRRSILSREGPGDRCKP